MKKLEFHNSFKPEGCDDTEMYGAVTTGAGLTWMDVYAEATLRDLVRVFTSSTQHKSLSQTKRQ